MKPQAMNHSYFNHVLAAIFGAGVVFIDRLTGGIIHSQLAFLFNHLGTEAAKVFVLGMIGAMGGLFFKYCWVQAKRLAIHLYTKIKSYGRK